MWVFVLIGVGIAVLGPVIFVILRAAFSSEPVWESLVDIEPSGVPDSPVAVDSKGEVSPGDPIADPDVKSLREEMTVATPAGNGRFSGIDARRSTRLERAIPLIIMGKDKLGEPFQERTSAVSLNLHGCRYPSRHDYPVETWVNLQVTEPNGGAKSPPVRAKVRSIHCPKTPRELYQVGVELETPGNVWGIPAPPEDWQQALGGNVGRMQAAAVAPAREPVVMTPMPPKTQLAPEQNKAEVAAFPSPPAAPAHAEPAREPGAAKPERVVITMDQLVGALQGRFQQAAEKAVQTAVATHLDEAVRKALCKIADVSTASVRQTEEFTEQRLESLVKSSREEVLSRLESRLGEVRSRWEEQQKAYRHRAEEIAQRLEKLVIDTQHSLTDAQKFIGRVAHELEPQFQSLHTRLDESVGRAAKDFEVLATSASARQLVQLAEGAQKLTEEASERLATRAAETVSQLDTAGGGASEQRLETLMSSSRDEILGRVEAKLHEVQSDWEEKQVTYGHRAEAIAEGLEKLATDARSNLANTQNMIEKTVAELEPQMRARLDESIGLAAKAFEAAAARVSDQQLLRLTEGAQMAAREASLELESRTEGAREASSQLEAHVTQTRLLLQNRTATNSISEDQLEGLVRPLREEILTRLEERLLEARSRWEEQQEVYRRRTEEIAQRLERLVSEPRPDLGDTQRFIEKAARELEPQIRARLEETVGRATEEFEAAAARVSDRQLVRLIEGTRMETREASSQLEARSAEARAMVQSAANGILDEFRRQAEVQVDLAISEATQRTKSSLTSLDAENRAACEARRRTLENDVARAAEQSTQEFRTGIKAFLYSCLVAAVSAVDEHTKTTLDGLVKDHGITVHEIGNRNDSTENEENRS
jgi:hypothetical protein